eukprot:694793-Pleurochrysis_carterae.AAC.3
MIASLNGARPGVLCIYGLGFRVGLWAQAAGWCCSLRRRVSAVLLHAIEYVPHLAEVLRKPTRAQKRVTGAAQPVPPYHAEGQQAAATLNRHDASVDCWGLAPSRVNATRIGPRNAGTTDDTFLTRRHSRGFILVRHARTP